MTNVCCLMMQRLSHALMGIRERLTNGADPQCAAGRVSPWNVAHIQEGEWRAL